MCKKSAIAIFAVIAAGLAAPAWSAERAYGASGFYGVASIGRSNLDADPSAVDQFNLRNGFTASNTSSSTHATAAKAQLGYQFTNSFGLEGGYTYLGKANFSSVTNLGTIGGSKEAALVNLDLVGTFPLGQNFSILGRIGGYYWKTESEMPNAGTLGTARVNDNGYDIKFGAGVQYDFTRTFALRGEFERFNGIGRSETSGDSKVNLFTLGAVLKF